MRLTHENYDKGFLVSEDHVVGISCVGASGSGHSSAEYVVYLISMNTGEYLAYSTQKTVEAALTTAQCFTEEHFGAWHFQELVPKCDAENCGQGNCSVAQGGECRATQDSPPGSCC